MFDVLEILFFHLPYKQIFFCFLKWKWSWQWQRQFTDKKSWVCQGHGQILWYYIWILRRMCLSWRLYTGWSIRNNGYILYNFKNNYYITYVPNTTIAFMQNHEIEIADVYYLKARWILFLFRIFRKFTKQFVHT